MEKLLIKIDSYVMTECWTFFKLAIIQTHPNYLEWLAGHMSLVMFDNYECFFGDKYGIFPIEYFNDILQYEEINVSSFAADNIIDVIKNEIDNGNYVMFDCNYNAFRENSKVDNHDIHEVLVHGYDDEKQIMFISVMSGNKFIEDEFRYNLIIKGYEWSLKYFDKYPKEIYYRRGWTYPVSRIRLKKDLYCFGPLFSFIHKLDNEFMGGKCTRIYLNDEGLEEKRTYYYGNDIIGSIADLCSDATEKDIKKLLT